ncbi:LytR/AlgR family response regulator transcription factor [Rhodoferax ferrireducens]|uniref:LytR/AlgR family response regulator transcription factor n=1 Tax=Rhodoferax ferrireducens TaxID=192843 RepID=UPI000E0D6C11|nr:LytTR family DNA-binding domain-containing protein [Rhodoferax ferrireducens]
MNLDARPTALIAEDEPLLAAALQAELARAWPELKVLAVVGDGASAVTQAMQLKPDVLFFDIRMPALSGLDAAAELADAWDTGGNTDGKGGTPFPALVFVTAYDQYAVQAFEAQAIDYLLKPIQAARLQKTLTKVQLTLANRAQKATDSIANSSSGLSQTDTLLDTTLAQLRQLLATLPGPAAGPSSAMTLAPLKVIQASVGNAIRMVPMEDVLCFEAADKYVRVLTAEREYLIRTPLKELTEQLDAQVFWQIHRGTVVRAQAIESVTRDEAGKTALSLRGRQEKFVVSRLYSHLFKAM